MSDPATAVFTRRVRPGHEAAYEQLAREAAAAATRYPGHLAATVLHKDGTVDYTVLYSFSDRAALDAWLDSPSGGGSPRRSNHFRSPITNRLASRDSRPGSCCRTSDAWV